MVKRNTVLFLVSRDWNAGTRGMEERDTDGGGDCD